MTTTATAQINYVVLGVKDIQRAKKFYSDLGYQIEQDYGQFASFKGGNGASALALYTREASAADAGVSPEGSGFPGVTFHHIVSSRQEVDNVLEQAKKAGAKIVKEGNTPKWGGYFGYFSDPDGYLWKVASPKS
jgi:uncharacterized protein